MSMVSQLSRTLFKYLAIYDMNPQQLDLAGKESNCIYTQHVPLCMYLYMQTFCCEKTFSKCYFLLVLLYELVSTGKND